MAIADPLFTFVSFLLNPTADFNPPVDSSLNAVEIDLSGTVGYSKDNPIRFMGGYADCLWGGDGWGDFCWEFAQDINSEGVIFEHTDPDAAAMKVYVAGGALKVDLGASVAAFSAPVGVNDGTVYYFVLVRADGQTSFYLFTIVDGALGVGGQVGAAVADANEYATNTGAFRLGADAAGANVCTFNLLGLRYTNGLTRYDAAPDSLPFIPFGAFVVAITGTVLDPSGAPANYRLQLWDKLQQKVLDGAQAVGAFGGTYELHAPYYDGSGSSGFIVLCMYTPDDPSTAPIYNDMIRRVSIPDPFF